MIVKGIKENKRGMLLASEVIKIVISVVVIVFLIYFLTLLYFSKINAEKLKEAKAILIESPGSIKNIIDSLQKNAIPEGKKEKALVNPESWYLFSFTKGKRPNSCVNKNCLCICDNVLVNLWDRQIKECDKNGACIIVENLDPKTDLEVKIKGKLTRILIKKENNLIKIEEI